MPKLPRLNTNPPSPVTYESLIDWLVSTGWVDAFIKARMNPLDRKYTDDYIQECWREILEVPRDKLLGVYIKGKGKFINYIKSVILNNIISGSSHLYKRLREGWRETLFLSSEEWQHLADGDPALSELTYCNRVDRKINKDGIELLTEPIYVYSKEPLIDGFDT